VNEYEELIRGETRLAPASELAQQLLLKIDAIILAGYGLPPRLERKLLKYFDGEERPVVSPFRGYDLDTFALYRAFDERGASLARLEDKRSRRAVLAQRMLDGSLSPEEDAELVRLDQALDHYADTVSPLPFDLLERLEAEARLDGVDTEGVD
jgi:hypothetical protein